MLLVCVCGVCDVCLPLCGVFRFVFNVFSMLLNALSLVLAMFDCVCVRWLYTVFAFATFVRFVRTT